MNFLQMEREEYSLDLQRYLKIYKALIADNVYRVNNNNH